MLVRDAVVACLLRERGEGCVILYCLFDFIRREFACESGIDGRAHCGRPDDLVVLCIKAGVQHLERNFCSSGVHGLHDRKVLGELFLAVEHLGAVLDPAGKIG